MHEQYSHHPGGGLSGTGLRCRGTPRTHRRGHLRLHRTAGDHLGERRGGQSCRSGCSDPVRSRSQERERREDRPGPQRRQACQADVRSGDISLTRKDISFTLKVPNHTVRIQTPMVGAHNLENILTAIAVTMSVNIPIQKTAVNLKSFPGAPGRLESIAVGQNFPVIVDHTYKPSALEPVLRTLKKITKGRLIVVWGGTGNRPDFRLFKKNLHLCAETLDKHADEIILTTDDPGPDDPRKIAKTIREKIDRTEGDRFFEIEDRYEAIRYAIYTAQADDLVLIAGRGTEKTQIIGKTAIHFDDREVAREVLSFAMEKDLLEKK